MKGAISRIKRGILLQVLELREEFSSLPAEEKEKEAVPLRKFALDVQNLILESLIGRE